MSGLNRIYLCGFMGCGKTTVGKILARIRGIGFSDLDEYIVKKEGITIPEIFEKYGEPRFRELEAKYIALMPEKSVTALGGGAIINNNTAAVAKKSGITVFLDVDFDTCYDRIKNDSNRPLVVNNTKERLLEIYNERKLIYAERADITVEGDSSPEVTAKMINEAINRG